MFLVSRHSFFVPVGLQQHQRQAEHLADLLPQNELRYDLGLLLSLVQQHHALELLGQLRIAVGEAGMGVFLGGRGDGERVAVGECLFLEGGECFEGLNFKLDEHPHIELIKVDNFKEQ